MTNKRENGSFSHFAICSDIRLFDQALRKSRDTDDKITNVLNDKLQRDLSVEDKQKQCFDLEAKLRRASEWRISLIKSCIEHHVKSEKSGLALRNLQNELIVAMNLVFWGWELAKNRGFLEQIVSNRSLGVLKERCSLEFMTATPKGDLRDQLNKSMFFPISERCICIVYVNDLTKKKKDERNVYLAANIVTEPEIQPVIHYMKLSEKTHEFKIKSTVLLKNVRSIDGRGEEPLRFDLEANKTHRLQCDNPIDKNNILLILYKLSNQYLRTGPSPSFQNFKFPDEITSVSVAQENVFEDFRNYQAITDDEQNRLLSLCSEWNIDLKDADVLMEKMVKTLVELDSANVNTIMRAEEDTLNMMNKLDDTIGDLTKIEDKLSNFEARFDLVADAVKHKKSTEPNLGLGKAF